MTGDAVLAAHIFFVDVHYFDGRNANTCSLEHVNLHGHVIIVIILNVAAVLHLAQPQQRRGRRSKTSIRMRTPECSKAASNIAGTERSAINVAVRFTAFACSHGASSTRTPPGNSGAPYAQVLVQYSAPNAIVVQPSREAHAHSAIAGGDIEALRYSEIL